MNKYLKSAYRNLIKRKLFSLVNIAGLTFGLVSALFIGTYVLYQFSYDNFYQDSSQLYRFNKLSPNKSSQQNKDVLTPTALKPYLDENLAQVELSARVQRTGNTIFNREDKLIREGDGFFTDPELLALLEVNMIEGDVTSALVIPDAIVISETLKEKYFKDGPALGKHIQINDLYGRSDLEFEVRGVYKDFPSNTQFRPNYLLSINKLKQFQRKPIDQEWSNFNAFTYVKLNAEVSSNEFEPLVADLIEKNSPYDLKGHILALQPLSEIHLQEFTAFGDVAGQVKKSNLYILLGIGVLILALVCINFFNMSTARSVERAEEIGIRKSIGASRRQLISQFMIEAAIQVSLGMVVSLIIFEVTGTGISGLLGLTSEMKGMVTTLGMVNFSLFLTGLWLMLVVGSGFYPALIISRFKAVDSLKGKINMSRSKVTLSRSLLALQFTITLIISLVAAIVFVQVKYMENANPGYDRGGVISLKLFDDEKLIQLRDLLDNSPLIESVTFSDDNVVNIFNSGSDYSWPGKDDDESIKVFRLSVDNNFLDAMGVELIAGRGFNKAITTDDQSVVLNESAAVLMGISPLKELPRIKKGDAELQVVGIVRDFQAGTMRQEDKPIVLYRNPKRFYQAYIRLNEQQQEQALFVVRSTWEILVQDQPFEYKVLDNEYQSILADDKASGKTLLFFTVVSVVISFIGLFGMTSLRVQTRLKELGIRKILGANYRAIYQTLSIEFRNTFLFAIVLGIPLAWYIGSQWLNQFAERIEVTFSTPFLVVLFMTVLGLVTLYLSTIKFIRTNPVDSLREN